MPRSHLCQSSRNSFGWVRQAAFPVALCLAGCSNAPMTLSQDGAPPPGVVGVPGGCQLPVAERVSDVGCYFTASVALGELSTEPLFWHLDVFPTRAAAEAVRTPKGVVTESFGQVWLFTVDGDGWRPSGGERVAMIGPLLESSAVGAPYIARFMEAVFPPGLRVPFAHRHSGPEAWYLLSGGQCLETPEGIMIARAGEGMMVREGPPMAISSVGTEMRRSVLLVLHPASESWSSPAPDWLPPGNCPS